MIDNSKEYIACSAIHYDNGKHYAFMNCYGINSGFVLCGFRHPLICSILPTNSFSKNIVEKAKWLNIDWSINSFDDYGKPVNDINIVQGFMTSLGRFVDRKEAAKIALESGQVQNLNSEDILFSEDIFPNQAIKCKI